MPFSGTVIMNLKWMNKIKMFKMEGNLDEGNAILFSIENRPQNVPLHTVCVKNIFKICL